MNLSQIAHLGSIFIFVQKIPIVGAFLIFSSLFRLNVRSDGVVQFYEPKIVCKLFDRQGSSQISFDFASSKVGPNMNYEDSVFWFYVCDRPDGFE